MTNATSTLNEIDVLLNDLTADASVADADLVAALGDIRQRVDATARALTQPLTHEQRSAMFGLFTDIFGSSPKPARRVFTRLVLGKAQNVPVSWANDGTGTITQREAAKVLDALFALKAALG
jgi:hypothetical protein